MSDCFMIRTDVNQGGNAAHLNGSDLIIQRIAAFGDVVASTIVVDKLHDLGFSVGFASHPSMFPILKRHPRINNVLEANRIAPHIRLDGAYEKSPYRRTVHFYELFIRTANEQLASRGINIGKALNCRPRLYVHPKATEILRKRLASYPKPWIFICPRSDSYRARQIPDHIWEKAASKMPGTKFWIARGQAPKGIVNLQVGGMDDIINFLTLADLLVTVDTGPMHIANAIGKKVLAICQSSNPELHLSDQTDFFTIAPKLDCLNCQENTCPLNAFLPPCQTVDPELISAWTADRLRSMLTEEISAVIPIFRPDASMLNRCLEAVLPQVSEIVVTRERGGIVPRGTISDPKIRHVVKPAEKIGFGRNVNFGFRHTKGKYVLVLNDDVYLAPDAVAHMMDVMKPDVGIVGMLLRYPDGTIYHAGKLRQPGSGGIGFPHVDLRKTEPTIKTPMEMENTNGASFLIRRDAFYDAGGYDEEFQFYAEDDDLCMKIRLAGWKLMYTPFATGIHDEHRETRKIKDINFIMRQSNQRFGQKWGTYFKHNANNPGLGNFNYLKTNAQLPAHQT